MEMVADGELEARPAEEETTRWRRSEAKMASEQIAAVIKGTKTPMFYIPLLVWWLVLNHDMVHIFQITNGCLLLPFSFLTEPDHSSPLVCVLHTFQNVNILFRAKNSLFLQ